MSSNLFDILDADAEEYGTRRAAIVAVARAKKQMGAFFKQAADEADFDARLNLVADKLNDIVREACVENTTSDFQTVAKVLAGELARYAEVLRNDVQNTDVAPSEGEDESDFVEHTRGNAGHKLLGLPTQFEQTGGKVANADLAKPCSVCGADDHSAMAGHDWSNGRPNDKPAPSHPDDRKASKKTGCAECDCKDCTGDKCGCCATCGGESKTAASTETGDTYTQNTETLPKAGPSGLSEEPSPKMDKGTAGDENHTSQKPIDIPSVQTNPEQQDADEHADYTKALEEVGVVKQIDADSPLQPEFNAAPNTQTFPNKDQANPVTSKWKLID